METRLLELRTGHVAPLGAEGIPSGIDKAIRVDPVLVRPAGLDGDEQGDTRRHGGFDKAVHHYPREHYSFWRRELPEADNRLTPGGFGENFVTDGWTEANICVGDVIAAGSAVLQVTQARQPCWKLNLRFGIPHMAVCVQRTLRTGWYYRVLNPGVVAAGDRLRLIDRICPGWPLSDLLHILYVDVTNVDALAAMASLEPLATSWKLLAKERLERQGVEDWAGRLVCKMPI